MYTNSPSCILLSLHSDQFCSLVYSFSNFYFIGCLYSGYFPNVSSSTASTSIRLSLASLEVFPRSFLSSSLVGRDDGVPMPATRPSVYDPAIQDAWTTCGAEKNWAPYFALAMLPYMIRFLQSLRRYWDSRLPTHLINVSLNVKQRCLSAAYCWCAGWQVQHGYSAILLLLPLATRR